MENPNFYAILPADVRYCDDLTPFEKILYAEITSLTQKDGYCWAANKYFADLYKKSETHISLSIKKICELGFLSSEVDKKAGNKRKIYVGELKRVTGKTSLSKVKEPIKENLNTSLNKVKDPIKVNLKTSLNILKENNKYNNKYNNKNNNKISKDILYEKTEISFLEIFEEKILKNEEFLEKIKNKFEFENEDLKSSAENFFIYWTEKNENGKKERWQMQKTFDIQKRFYTWLNNEKKWNFGKFSEKPKNKTVTFG